MEFSGSHRNEVSTACTGPSVRTVTLHVHQRGSIIETTRLLEECARTSARDDLRHHFTIATIVCAQAASECILNEWIERHDAAAYKKIAAHQWSILTMAEEMLPKIDGTMPSDLIELSNMKNAVCHPPPELQRSGAFGYWVMTDGASRALAVVLSLEAQFFPDARPSAP